ncbi:MAG: inositol monophosphatase [Thermomicrobiales bacterium]|nr:inositol monophosphatase [Thermomicrobiales bacterium]
MPVPPSALEVAITAATGAGAILRERLANQRQITYKGVVDLVTDADQASEEHVLSVIQHAFPAHRFIGEEGVHASKGAVEAAGGFSWICDPLDGTTNYSHRYPHFAVSIALAQEKTILIGVIYDPMRDELFVAERGRGATLNGQPMRVSATEELVRSLLATGFAYDDDERDENSALWQAFMPLCQGVRRDGSAALDAAYVAAGRLDGFWEKPINAWDIAAGALLIEEAGGQVSCYGRPFDPFAREILSSNGLLHSAMEEVILSIVQ